MKTARVEMLEIGQIDRISSKHKPGIHSLTTFHPVGNGTSGKITRTPEPGCRDTRSGVEEEQKGQ